jgi:tetratricopeptide (TPR) repeat protein
MKALLLNSIGDREEAFTLAKLALKNDMKSHVCWHVYGLLWRSVKNFEEAIKAYKFALRLQPESQQIIRDLAMLQVQMRDYEGYVQSRKTMLQQRPQMRQNWTAMAIAHHLAGDLKAAEQVLTKDEETMTGTPSSKDIENSEAVLYKNTIIAELGETERALEHLEIVRKTNLDKTAVMELRAKYLLQLGRKEEAEKAYRQLLDRNSEYRAYYDGLEKALDLDSNDKQARKELYAEYAEKNAKLDAARRIPLDFLEGNDFREAADHYLRRMLTKGVPSTFNNVKALYGDPSKLKIITELVEGYKTLQTNGHSETNGDKSDQFNTSVLYFLAQHYNYKLSRDLAKATSYIDQLIEQSPKTYDYVMIKARILKHSGSVTEAAKTMNAARELDLADRYINTKCAKYQLRANDNASAIHTMSLFTRNETLGGALGDLIDMQSLMYLTEDGEAFARQRKFGPALKRFNTVADVFDIWNEDQFDFHTFSLRKGQIRAYIEMVRWEDTLHAHPFYTRAAIDAIKVYIAMFDNSALASLSYIRGLTHMTAEEQAAAKKQQKQERIKQDKLDNEQREADKKILAKKANASADGEVKKSDEDPQGAKFLETKEPLVSAMRFLTPLLEVGEKSFESQLCGFEVYLRRGMSQPPVHVKVILTPRRKIPPRVEASSYCFPPQLIVANVP